MRRPVTLPLWGLVLALLVSLVLGAAAGGSGSTEDKQSNAVSETTERPRPTSGVLPTAAPTIPTTTTTTGPRTSFGDGVWEVGVDIAAGKYKTDGGETCYWAKLKENDDIIDNDIPKGPSTVTIEPTVSKFKTSNCATWNKVG